MTAITSLNREFAQSLILTPSRPMKSKVKQVTKKTVPSYKKKSTTGYRRVHFTLPAMGDHELQGRHDENTSMLYGYSDVVLPSQQQHQQQRRQRYMRRGSKTASMLMAAQRILEATITTAGANGIGGE